MARYRKKFSQMSIDGIIVEDGKKPLVLNIKEADCKTGKRDPAGCAAAKAACRVDGVLEARVYRTRTYLLTQKNGKKSWQRYITPDAIRNELIAFDRGGTFEPDDYTLAVVSESQRLGVNRGKPPAKTGKRSGINSPHVVKGIRPVGPKGNHRLFRVEK